MKTQLLITIEHAEDVSVDGLITYTISPMINDIDSDIGEGYSITWERLTEKVGTVDRTGMCLNCDNFMVNEGHIEDDIQLCHGCYDRETLAKYYPQPEADKTVKTWKVSIWAMEEVEAGTKEEAEEMVNDMLIGCLIKTSDFDLDTEEVESE